MSLELITGCTFEDVLSLPHLQHYRLNHTSFCQDNMSLNVSYKYKTQHLSAVATFAGPNLLYIKWSMMYTVITFEHLVHENPKNAWGIRVQLSPRPQTQRHTTKKVRI